MPAEHSEPILIVGSGAMACLLAARLCAAGASVRMLASWPEGLRALQQSGVCLHDETGLRCYPVEAGSHPTAWQGARVALVLVKTWQTARAAAQLAALLAPDGLAVTLQNGLGNAETLAQHLGAERVAAGVTTLGAALIAPAQVRATGSGEITLGQHPRIAPLLVALQATGIPVRVEPDLQSLLWGKLIINAAINPVSALLGLPNGALLSDPHAWQVIAAAAQEAAAVAAALGVSLPYPDAVEKVRAILQATAPNRSSMLQDIQRGAPTEIDAINGTLVQTGQVCGVATPIHHMLWHLVRALSSKG